MDAQSILTADLAFALSRVEAHTQSALDSAIERINWAHDPARFRETYAPLPVPAPYVRPEWARDPNGYAVVIDHGASRSPFNDSSRDN